MGQQKLHLTFEQFFIRSLVIYLYSGWLPWNAVCAVCLEEWMRREISCIESRRDRQVQRIFEGHYIDWRTILQIIKVVEKHESWESNIRKKEVYFSINCELYNRFSRRITLGRLTPEITKIISTIHIWVKYHMGSSYT